MPAVKMQSLHKWAGQDLHSQELSSHVIITDTIDGMVSRMESRLKQTDAKCEHVISLYIVKTLPVGGCRSLVIRHCTHM
jgi:hypothetical protein